MSCTNPREAYWPPAGSDSRQLIFSGKPIPGGVPLKVPCQKCLRCRLNRSADWAVRCVHEAALHSRNSFITITYNDQYLPANGSLVQRDYQLFLKRLRRSFGPFRYYMCGEYGEKGLRPHYHFCLFGLDFPDQEYKHTENGIELFTSKSLSDIWRKDQTRESVLTDCPWPSMRGRPKGNGQYWPNWAACSAPQCAVHKGFCTVGTLTFDSAAYVARYITKKNLSATGWVDGRGIYHPGHNEHYKAITFRKKFYRGEHPQDPDARFKIVPVDYLRLPEFTNMSRAYGIGKKWIENFTGDVYPHDRVVLQRHGKPPRIRKPPKYYDSVYEISDPFSMDEIRARRSAEAKLRLQDATYERLRVKERHQMLCFRKLKRGYEDAEDIRSA